MIKDSIITIGTFDGLHKGHQYLLSNLISLSKALSFRPVVLTIPMPAKFYLDPKNFLGSLTTPLEKMKLLKEWIKSSEFLDFKEIKNIEAKEFVEDYLIKKYNMKAIIVGHDFRFGKGRKGDFDFLLSNSLGRYKVFRAKEHRINGKRISSSKIRILIKSGKIEEANFLLGRRYFINGVVSEGMKLARKIGFPTANVTFDPYKIVPTFGVYWVKTRVDEIEYDSIGYISQREKNGRIYNNLEVHIFNFNRNIYSKPVSIGFERFLRPPIKFSNIDEAKIQIKKDIKKLKNEIFGI